MAHRRVDRPRPVAGDARAPRAGDAGAVCHDRAADDRAPSLGRDVSDSTGADLQIRAYVLDGPSAPILDRIVTAGLAGAVALGGRDAAFTASPSSAPWRRHTLAYTMRYADYAGRANIDFFIREFGPSTVVLVFMHAPGPRWSWAQPMAELVGSFAWPGR